MSYPARGPGAPYGASSGNRGGSVRAARLRAEQGEPPQSRPPPPNMSPQSGTSRNTNWPLPEGYDPAAAPRQRGPPPQRPPRPRYVPSILDPTKVSSTERLAPPGQSPVSPDGDLLSPYFATRDPNRMTGNSVNSASSLGSIPDFPVPNTPGNSRKPPALGPPPSARRGPSSYYSQTSYVSPIVEEAESHRSHNSFASSNVIPANAGDFYFDEDITDDEDDLGSPTERGDSDDGRSRPSDDGDQSGLVRQASMGKRGKPSLTTIKSMDSMDKLRERDKNGQAAMAMPAAAAMPVGLAVSKKPSGGELRGGTGLMPPSPSTSSSNSNSGSKSPLSKEMLDDDLDSPIDPRVDEILGGLEKGGALSGFGKESRAPSKLSDRVGTRRPPKLNVDAVQEAESRGSLTSLPDLIRRATKLASNLDRGKTASRLGFDLWELGGPNADEKRAAVAAAVRRSDGASLADMLTSFPRPATSSPRSPPRSPYGTRWPTGLAHEQHYGSDQGPPKKRGRRCCGMPLWGFVILIIVLLLLVAAAVVVPIALIVLPKNNDSSSNSAQQKSVSGCESTLPCSNGGTSMLDPTGSCACICANGYTGASCTQAPDSGCSTTNMGGSSNATIGSAVTELINDAQASFQIPLNGTQLLALFSRANMSCSAENALVTFSGLSKSKRSLDWLPQIGLHLDFGDRHRHYEDEDDEEEPPLARPAPGPVPASPAHGSPARPPLVTPHAQLQRRQYSNDAAKTNLGIVYDANGGSSMYSATSTLTSSPTSTSTSTTSATSGVSPKRLAFCKTGVLYVFQASGGRLDHAVTAQENLQTYFVEYGAGGQAAMSATAVSLGNGWTIDLTGWTVKDAQGKSVGNSGGGAGGGTA
ncbi:uncharacterized protein J3D65DRAFT_371793 [Phyllosticta citribraziliensis]|uniref:EGF-like domain-containing protein n=1 Tax=Phyllosticta citribraziliensis TaxID=989973 RepID=A0ABR1LPX1_9PEZI